METRDQVYIQLQRHLDRQPVGFPAQTREALYDIVMAHKKGRLGKAKVVGKLLIDAFRTGQTHLLR